MRFIALIVAFSCTASALAEGQQRYFGIVRRAPDGKPIAGLRVTANVDPAPSLFFFLGPRTYSEVGRTRTAKDGTFTFTLSAPQRRLWFMARGMPKITRDTPSHSTVHLGDVVLRHPRADRINVIEVPNTFRPRKEGLYDLDAKRPNHAMQRTAGRSPF